MAQQYGRMYQDTKQLAGQVSKVSAEDVAAWNCKISEGENFIKTNVDAAVRENFTTAAAVLQDHKGDFKGAVAKKFKKI